MGELERRPNAWALTPLVVFLLTYLVVSIVAGDFYKMPITVAFVISSIVAIAISKGGKLSNRIEQFCRGAANSNIMLMVLIFILAGAFAQTAKAMGAVDATVNLAMSTSFSIFICTWIKILICIICQFQLKWSFFTLQFFFSIASIDGCIHNIRITFSK